MAEILALPGESHFRPPSYFMRAMDVMIGQYEARRKLAGTFSHYTAFLDDESLGSPVFLAFGPSGSGKTFAIELCCKAIDLPFTIIGGAGVSAAGYKGITLRDLLADHYLRHRMSEGVIFVDEIDKWCRGAIGKDPEQISMGINKQGECLRYVEHEDVSFVDEARDDATLRERLDSDENENTGIPLVFNTRRSFWIFAGAFGGIDLGIRERLGQDNVPTEDIWEKAAPADFVRYGMMLEFVNRVSVWSWLKPLKQDEILAILQAQEHPKAVRLFRRIGCELDLELGAMGLCANLAVEEKTGARGAVSRLERVLKDVFTECDLRGIRQVTVTGRVMMTGQLEL